MSSTSHHDQQARLAPMSHRGLTVPDRWTLVCAIAIMVITCLIALPDALTRWTWSPDSIEHVAIANAFVQGRGWVDPVFYSYYLEDGPPLPAVAMRAPMISLLLSGPLALGADVTRLQVFHVIWAGLVSAALLIVARRFMALGAAAASTALLVLSPAWKLLTIHLWTEITGIAAYLLVLVTCRGVVRSVATAWLCATATALAWLTRPNLGPLAIAVVAAAVWHQGFHHSLRCRPLWSYLGGVAFLYFAVQLAAHAAFGVTVYEGYGANQENLVAADAWRYGYERVGFLAFVSEHWGEMIERMRHHASRLFEVLCLGPSYHFAGWWAPVGLMMIFVDRRTMPLEQRVNAFAALGFSAIIVLNYAGFDPNRYPLMSAVTLVLLGVPLFVDGMGRVATRWRPGFLDRKRASETWLWTLPVGVCLTLIGSTTLTFTVSNSLLGWRAVRAGRVWEVSHLPAYDPSVKGLCPHIPPDSVVVAGVAEAWILNLWCGNAVFVLPSDISDPRLWRRFRAERKPSYMIVSPGDLRRVGHLPGLHFLVRAGPLSLFAVADAPDRGGVWRAPSPVACTGIRDCPTRPRRGAAAPRRAGPRARGSPRQPGLDGGVVKRLRIE